MFGVRGREEARGGLYGCPSCRGMVVAWVSSAGRRHVVYDLHHHRVTWLGLRRPARTRRAATLRADLYHITVDGLFYSLMLGFGEMYLAKFVLALDLGQVASGLVTTVPLLLASLLALGCPWLLRRVGSFARFIGTFASLQAFMLVPLAGLAVGWPFIREAVVARGLTWLAASCVFACVTLYHFGAVGTGAAWMTSTGELIPPRLRARYTARRLRLLQVAVLLAILAHGAGATMIERLLGSNARLASWGLDPVLAGIAVMFLLAAACRAVSAWHLFRYSTPALRPGDQVKVPPREFVARFSHGDDGRFLIYAIAAYAALQVAQPFFNPYLLRGGAMAGPAFEWVVATYGPQAPYSILIAAIYVGRMLVLDLSGTLAHRHGPRRLLWMGNLALPFLAVFWLFSTDFVVLVAGQVATGAVLGMWELGVFLMNFEAIRPRERTAVLTYFTVANETGKTTGSLAGGWMLDAMGKDHGAYAAVFWTSFAARAAVMGLLARVRRTRHVEDRAPTGS